MPEFSQKARDMAAEFMGGGGGGSASRPGSRMPRGLNVGNMREFAGTPAGKALVGHIRKNVGGKRKATTKGY